MHFHRKAPVDHGDVAGVDVDADTISRFGISSPADGVQTLERTGEPNSDEGTSAGSGETCKLPSQLTHGDKVHFFFGGFGDGERQPPHLNENKTRCLSTQAGLKEAFRSILYNVALSNRDRPVAMTT